MRYIASILSLLLSGALFAMDLRLNDGATLADVRLRSKTDTGITVAHRDGIAGVDYMKMALPDARTFGYEEAKYQAAIKNPPTTAIANAPVANVAPVAAPQYRPERLYQSPPSPPAPAVTAAAKIKDAERGQCAATTKKGFRCSRMAESGRSYCWQHP